MPCPCNQNEIDKLDKKIKDLQDDIEAIDDNIKKCKKIKENHENFKETISGCVIFNLSENHVKAGEPYDKNGNMDNCIKYADETINDCDNIISESKQQKIIKENSIVVLKAEKKKYQGDCSNCATENDVDSSNS